MMATRWQHNNIMHVFKVRSRCFSLMLSDWQTRPLIKQLTEYIKDKAEVPFVCVCGREGGGGGWGVRGVESKHLSQIKSTSDQRELAAVNFYMQAWGEGVRGFGDFPASHSVSSSFLLCFKISPHISSYSRYLRNPPSHPPLSHLWLSTRPLPSPVSAPCHTKHLRTFQQSLLQCWLFTAQYIFTKLLEANLMVYIDWIGIWNLSIVNIFVFLPL